MKLDIAFNKPLCCHVPDKLSKNGRYKYELLKEERFTVKFNRKIRRSLKSFGLKEGDVLNYADGLVVMHWKWAKAWEVIIKPGFAWDGASGPTFDRKENHRGSLLHDVLYGCMREGLLPQTCRGWADRAMINVCKKMGMWSITGLFYIFTLGKFGRGSTTTGHDPYVYEGQLYLYYEG